MKFKPITNKYKFDTDDLTIEYPEYLKIPIGSWIQEVLFDASVWTYKTGLFGGTNIDSEFLNNLDINLRERFPGEPENFLHFVFADSERTTNVVGICLQNYAKLGHAHKLEKILDIGGSAYTVTVDPNQNDSSTRGVGTLTDRVPDIVQDSSQNALNNEALIREAWLACYSRNPDYERTVSRCCDVIEKIWGKKYFSNDPKPQVKKFVHFFKDNPTKLSYSGATVINPKNVLSDLAESFSDIRGQHSTGKGRSPIKEEAEFVLHYTILLWNLER